MAKREFRFGVTPELRGEENPKIVGYAAVFNQETDLGYVREVIKPGAFKRNIEAGVDVRALVEHDPKLLIGRTKAGTLTLAEDDHGLYVEITPADTQVGRDVVTNLRNGNLDKMSFGFFLRGKEMRKVDGQWLREVTDADVFDVSIVSQPAYEGTSVQARSLFPDGDDHIKKEIEHLENPTPETEDVKLRSELESVKAELVDLTKKVEVLTTEKETFARSLESAMAECDALEAKYFDVLERTSAPIAEIRKLSDELRNDINRRLRLKKL